MGLIRKAASMSTLGGVKYTSRREAQTKEAIANARLARTQNEELAANAKLAKAQAAAAQNAQWDEILAAFQAGEVISTNASAPVSMIRVRRSLKRGTAGLAPGDLKTQSSKRTLTMPDPVRLALTALRKEQAADRLRLGPHYADQHDLVFRDDAGRPMSRQRLNVRFKEVLGAAGLGADWQPRETRHTAISIGSEHGASIEDLADMAGHANPNVTRATYRHVISDTVTRAPAALDQALAAGGGQA